MLTRGENMREPAKIDIVIVWSAWVKDVSLRWERSVRCDHPIFRKNMEAEQRVEKKAWEAWLSVWAAADYSVSGAGRGGYDGSRDEQ
jgi:hypothetical protein